ncbi:TadE/TadG family type IV pilus assembly protein [Litorimonas sp. RW-G-Af-16]|uniref:TadE/TadG family type IV pilus assembly protein n=1 Tax=Litorimonas sp. RW-G-Af-16 TaxID=3241168 RepID=UPI00390C4B52
MKTLLKTKLLTTALPRKIAELRSDTNGIAAVEFALIAPVMIAMYFGLAEIAQAISVDRKISQSTSVAGDLATQIAKVSAEDMSEIMAATLQIANINDTENYKLEVASYSMNADGDVVLLGKAILNDGPQTFKPFDPESLDSRILNQTSGVVVARTAYVFEPLKLKYMKTDVNLRETFLLKPRRSAAVQFGDAEGTEFSCSATNPSSVICSSAASGEDDDNG